MRLEDLLIRQGNRSQAAVICGERELSYRQWAEQAKELAARVEALNGDTSLVGLFLPGCLYFPVAYFAILMAERGVVPLEIKATAEELRATADYTRLSLILTDSGYLTQLAEALEGAGFRITALCVDTGETVCLNASCPVLPAGEPERDGSPDDVALVLHTSGTTSRPKRVMLTHRALLSQLPALKELLGEGEESRTLVAFPVFLVAANLQLLTQVYLGGAVVYQEGYFMPRKAVRLIERHRLTHLSCAAFMVRGLLASGAAPEQLASLRAVYMGGGPAPDSLFEQWAAAYPAVPLIHSYGLPETCSRIVCLFPQHRPEKNGGVGWPLPGVELRVADEAGVPCPPDTEGELLIRGPFLMKGYLRNPEATRQALQDGWLHTGDIAVIDADGCVYLRGRKKNVLISAGMNIYPEAVEEVLLRFPGVREALVTGRDDPVYDQVVCARIVAAEDLSLPELREHCRRYLKSYQQPRFFERVDELPKTPSGKPLRGR